MIKCQKTIKKAVSFKGIAMHSGQVVNVKLIPEKSNTGIIFKRTDLKKEIKVSSIQNLVCLKKKIIKDR